MEHQQKHSSTKNVVVLYVHCTPPSELLNFRKWEQRSFSNRIDQLILIETWHQRNVLRTSTRFRASQVICC